jgi:hypothetical protein
MTRTQEGGLEEREVGAMAAKQREDSSPFSLITFSIHYTWNACSASCHD